MPRLKTRVTLEGVEEVQARLKDPTLVQQPMQEYLTEASDLARRAATARMDGGRGIAVRSVGAKITPLNARVYSAMPAARSRSIDRGRKPGASLNELLPGLIRWREAVHAPERAITIARQIQRRGVEGRFFKRAAIEAVTNAQPRLWQEMLGKLKGRWKHFRGLS
jgi:hypothetical protein